MNYLRLFSILICMTLFSCKTDQKENTTTVNDELKEVNRMEEPSGTEENTTEDISSEKKDVDLEEPSIPKKQIEAETKLNSDKTSTPDTKVKATKTKAASSSKVDITPINHGTLILEYENVVFYVDPVGGLEAFTGQKPPTLILITDIHGDHLNIETIEAVSASNTKIIAPIAVADKLPKALRNKTSVLTNFQSKNYSIGNANLTIEGIPMYNLRKEALKYHPKNRGNGYLLTLGKERVYISGDTEDIPEMRNLKNIDIAFICMNLPYTMTVESAADAVLDFKPKKVYPYHYRGTNGMSDIKKFKTLVNSKNKSIQVIQDKWY